jgi:molybdate transport system substrate-binding protein
MRAGRDPRVAHAGESGARHVLRRLNRTFGTCVLSFIACLLFAAPPARATEASPPPSVIVFAAASLKTALDEVASSFARESGQRISVSYAGTGTLVRQLEQGAPADLFFSADQDWMDYALRHELVQADSVDVLLGNRLALVAPRDSRVALRLVPGAPLAAALGQDRLAVANIVSVPAGRYAKAALESLGLWPSVAGRLVQTENVRAALRLVERGEAPLGIVYATDARAEPGVRVVDVFDAALHPPIRYPVALARESASPAARRILAWLRSPEAAAIFEAQGFTVLPPVR